LRTSALNRHVRAEDGHNRRMEQGREISPLELLHPDGMARRASVIGGGCPEALRPRRPEPGAGGHADLVVLAPTRDELREPAWLVSAVEATAASLASDGVVYVLSPPRSRLRIVRLLANRGIAIKMSFIHDPDTAGLRCLVPLSPAAATYAFTNLVATRPGRRRIVLLALRAGWIARLLARALPGAGLAAGRPTSRPLFDWLFALRGEDVHTPIAVVSVSWRSSGGSLVAHGFADRVAGPAIVAKVRGPRPPGPVEEAAIIQRLGRAAGDAGVAVPEPLLVETGEYRALMLETALEGRVAAAILAETPALVPSVMRRLVEWLENWNADTRSEEPLSTNWSEQEVAEPARALAPLLSDGGRYLEWLESRCRALAGTAVPLVATHNDLTMVNVFVGHSGSLGVVDWESAREQGLPLVDFYYAAVDAAAAANRYADRLAAFREQFGDGAGSLSTARELERRLVETLGLRPEIAELAFHVCWIQHAAVEQRATLESARRPFLEILRSVADSAR
jgi:hypothetical protein